MKRVVIVHGYKGRPETNWKPWLKRELEDRGYMAQVPEMPDTDKPEADAWVRTLSNVVGAPSADFVLVGHSLGGITILRYLETLLPGQLIGKVILVAGFGRKFSGYQGGHDSFFDHELDWAKIRSHCGSFVVIHSEDDKNVDYSEHEFLTDVLQAKFIAMQGMGHFGSGDGVYETPIVRDEIVKSE